MTDNTYIIHTLPVNDMFDHDEDGDHCVCGPTVEHVERDDDITAFMIIHNSFDGRELHE